MKFIERRWSGWALACLVVLLAARTGTAQETAGGAGWIGTWGAAPLPPTASGGGPFPATPSFENRTIRQVVRLSAGGHAVRLRLTNEYGPEPLTVGAATIALAAPDGTVESGSERVVTFDGDTSTTIPAGAPLLSDPVDLDVDPLQTLSISLYFPDDTGPCTCHASGLQTGYVSEPGDFTGGEFEPDETIESRAFLSGVEVSGEAPGHAVVVLGDSISDGVGSTLDANRRWPDLLAERLAARDGDGRWGIVNMGISGNRVLSDGAGESALARFDRDVLAAAGATHVVVFEGINDIGLSFGSFGGPGAAPPSGDATAEALIAGFRQLIARAHASGLRIYGATIAPYEGAGYFSEEGEAVRQAVNEWIRDGGEFDAVLDFDAVLRDPDAPSRMAEGMHSGDWLHGSDAGYRALAESIDLSLFR